MRNLILILLIALGTTVQAQFTALTGVVAKGDGGTPPVYSLDASNLYVSQFSDRFSPPGGIRITGVGLNSTGTQAGLVSDNEVMLNIVTFDGDPWDLKNMSYDSQVNIEAMIGGATAFYDIQLSPTNSSKFFVADVDQDDIHQFNLSTGDDFTSTVTLDGAWDTSQNNVGAFEMSPDGTKVTYGAFNNPTVYTYDMGTTGQVTGSNTLNDSDLILTSGSDTDIITSLSSGTALVYTDSDAGGSTVGFSKFLRGTFGTPYVMDNTFIANESTSIDWNGMCDRVRALRRVESDDSFIGASWGNDHLIKFRDITLDTYETGKEYDFNLTEDIVAGFVPYQLNELTSTVSWVMDINIPSTFTPTDNELLGSTSSNFLRFDLTGSTLFIQLFDGSSSNSNGATFVPDGTYHQIAVTYSAANNQRIYVDGVLIDTGTDADVPNWSGINAEQVFQIGSRSGGTSYGEFQIRGFQLYSDELTPTEVSNINTDFSDTAGNLEVYYHDQKGEFFWEDESGNNRHGGMENVTKQNQ